MRQPSLPPRNCPPRRTFGAYVTLAAMFCAALVACASTGAPASPDRAASPPASGDAVASATAEIRAMMARSAEAWNRGDLDAFVTDYAPGPGTTYIGSRGVTRGPEAIRASYAPRFRPGVERGTLRFEELEVDVLAPGVVNAIAYYVLTARTAAGADTTIGRGPTSLVMRKTGGRWLIVHDHSS